MTIEAEQEVARNRANSYKLLSLLYQQPTEEVEDLLQYLKESLDFLAPSIVSLVEEMEEDFNKIKSDITALKIDHAKLFIGPFDVLAPPYSSIYIDGERKIMSDSTVKAIELYRDAGLDIDSNFKDVPDHITAELEFMYYLIAKSLNTSDDFFINHQQTFLNSHLGQWLEPFTERIVERTETAFYKNLAIVTKKFLDQELQRIS